jgi:hypothetical protein
MRRFAIVAGGLLLAACEAPMPEAPPPTVSSGWAEIINLGLDGPLIVYGWALINGKGCVEATGAHRLDGDIVLSGD